MISAKYTPQEISGVPLETVQLRYEVVAENRGDASVFNTESFTLSSGVATLAGRPLRSAHLSRTGVHWAENLDGLGFCTGVLRFSPDRLWLRGYVHCGPDAHHLTRHELMGAVREERFQLETRSGRQATLAIGYSGGSIRQAPVQRIELEGVDISSRSTLEHVPGSGLRLQIKPRPMVSDAKPDWLAGGWLHLDLGTASGAGLAQVSSIGQNQPRSEHWTATGTLAVGDPPPASSAAVGDTTLTVEQLAACDLSGSEAASQSLIQQNMLWCMEQNWVDAFFPPKVTIVPPTVVPSRPDFSSQYSRMAVVDQDCEWYNTRFAAGFLGLAVDDAIHKLQPADRLKLQYYLSNQITLEPAYTRQTEAIATLAAITACPTLAAYVTDWQENGTNWPQQLSAYLNQPDQLTSIVQTIQTQTESGMAQLDDNATLLTVFDETGALASAYYNNVILALTGSMAFEADISQDSTLPDWLPDYIQTFIDTYYTGKQRPASPGGDQTAFDIAEDLYQGTQAAGSTSLLVQQIITQLKSTNAQGLGAQAAEVQQNLAGGILSKSLFSVFIAAGLVASIYAITNWDDLPADEQGTAIVNLVSVIYNVGTMVPDIVNFAEWTTANLTALCERAMASTQVLNALATESTPLIPRAAFTTRLFGWLAGKFDAATKSLNLAGTRVASLFQNATKLIQAASAVLAAAALAMSIWSLVSDVSSGADGANIVFDSIQVVMGYVVLVCSVLALLPGVDIIVGIIGIAAALISAIVAAVQFLYNLINKPANPAEDFMKQVVQPLLATLPAAPDGWSPPQTA